MCVAIPIICFIGVVSRQYLSANLSFICYIVNVVELVRLLSPAPFP